MSATAHARPELAVQERRPAPDDPAPGREPAAVAPSAVALRDSSRVLGALSIVAGVLHAKAFIDHAAHYWLFGVFFGGLACWQTAWGVLAYRSRLSRRALVAGAYVSVAVVGVWLVTRTVGLPVGPWAGDRETIRLLDLMATIDEIFIAAMVAALVSVAPRRGLAWLRGGYAVRIGIMLGTASMFATTIGGHTH